MKTKKQKVVKKKMLFVPFSEDSFLPGNCGIDYLNAVLWQIIEDLNRKK